MAPHQLLRSLPALPLLALALVGCSSSSDVGCYYSPLVANVNVTVSGVSDCEDYSVAFLDEDEEVLETVALSSACSAVYLPDTNRSLDEVTVQLVDSSDELVVEETAERPYYDTQCYTGYDEITVALAVD